MPKLKNQRHEKFAQLIFKGLTQMAAYKKAGYRGNAKSAAILVFQQSDVQARITELNGLVVRSAVLTKTQALEMLTRGALAAFKLIQTAGVFNRRMIEIDPKALEKDPELKLAVKEVILTEAGECKIKLHDYKEALALLAKLEGWEAPKTLDVRSHKTIQDMTDAELVALGGGTNEAPSP